MRKQYTKRKMDLKGFVEKTFKFSYGFVYQKKISTFINRAFDNYERGCRFACNDVKISKIISLGVSNIEDIETLCFLLSDSDLDEVKPL